MDRENRFNEPMNQSTIVNTRNKETFTNPGLGTDNSDPLEASEVPLTMVSPLISPDLSFPP